MVPSEVCRRLTPAYYAGDLSRQKKMDWQDALDKADSWGQLPRWIKDFVVNYESQVE